MMDGQQLKRDRSPSTGHQANVQQAHSPTPNSFATPAQSSVGIGLGLDSQQHQQAFATGNASGYQYNSGDFLSEQPPSFSQASPSASATVFDQSQSFAPQNPSPSAESLQHQFATPGQATFLAPNSFDNTDFPLFQSSSGQGDQFDAPLFDQATVDPASTTSPPAAGPSDMTSPQMHHTPTPPHMLRDGSPSPAYSGHQYMPPPPQQQQQQQQPGGHSRHTSLDPQAALMPNQMGDWSQPQFQTHRRSVSEYSEVSSANPSPHMVTHDSFDADPRGHSPLQQAALPDPIMGIGSFSLSDPQASSPHLVGRSPSHSPAVSPRLHPQSMPDMAQGAAFGLGVNNAYPQTSYPPIPGSGADPFPALQNAAVDPSMAAPSISIDFAPNNSRQSTFAPPNTGMNQDGLTPPERGRPQRRRAHTDPFNNSQPRGSPSMSPAKGSGSPGSESARSLSPFDRQSVSPSRRRQSTSSVPNNVIALRLADPEYQNSAESGNTKRAQKHPATFQCTLCPKRFTRAYNLRSHLRTHTDERPFVCTVCGKAFARQHDRKRHESLHSGEKKFVCKGDLKNGNSWGCGRRFARADALGRHFRSEAGRICIKPLLDEEMLERQRQWQEQRMQQSMAQNMSSPAMGMDPNTGYPMDPNANFGLPAALLAQYPALATMNWSANDPSSGMEDELSGRSSFDASDYDQEEDGYVSGPGTGFGEGGMGQGFGEMGYSSDYGR